MSKIVCAQICPFITDCSCDHLHTYTHLCLCVVFVNTAEHSPCARCNSVILSVRRCIAYRILLIVSENECSDKGRQCLRPFASNDKQRVQCRGRQRTQLLVLCGNLALTPVVTSLSVCPYLLFFTDNQFLLLSSGENAHATVPEAVSQLDGHCDAHQQEQRTTGSL